MDRVQLVREIYEAWGAGKSARDLIHEDVEYVNPIDAVEPGTRRGRKAFRGIRDVYDELSIEPERIVPLEGDEVLVIARMRGRARASGVQMDWRQGYIWTVRDGQAVRFRWFNTPREALEAVGLAESNVGES